MCLRARFDLRCHTLIVEPNDSQCYTDEARFSNTLRITLTSLDNLWEGYKQQFDSNTLRITLISLDNLWESSRSKF